MTMRVLKMQTLAKVQGHCDAMMQSRVLTRADARIQPRWQSEKQVNRPLQDEFGSTSSSRYESGASNLCRGGAVRDDQDNHGMEPTSAVERRAAPRRVQVE